MTTAFALTSDPSQLRTVSYRHLMALYLVIPLVWAAVLLDQLYFDEALKDFLPEQPGHWAYWFVIFNIPHIAASLLSFADREYIEHYKKPLRKSLLVAGAISFILPYTVGPDGWVLAMAFYTGYHALMQQYGIGLMILGMKPTRAYHWWRWMSIIPSGCMVLLVFNPVHFDAITNMYFWTLAVILAVLCYIPGIIVAFQVMRHENKDWLGRLYFWGNFTLPGFSCLYYALDYFALVVIVPRVIHDLTAFYIYMTHDHNRNQGQEKPPNIIYRAVSWTGIPFMIWTVIFGVSIAYILDVLSGITIIGFLLTSLITFLHYHVESSIWKRGTPHRDHIKFVR